MSWLEVFDSFAKGTLVDDTLQRIEEGLDQFDKVVGAGEQHISALADTLEQGVQQVVEGADTATEVANKVVEAVDKLPELSK